MGRKGKKTGKSKMWNISLTSLFMVLYAMVKFGFVDVLQSIMKGSLDLGAAINGIMNKFNMKNMLDVMMVGIQVKLIAAIVKALGGGSIGKFWKLNLRW